MFLCKDDKAFLYLHLSCSLCCLHTVLFLSEPNAPERFITSENVREGTGAYEAEGNEHRRTNSKPASTDSNNPHLVSVHNSLYVCMYMFVWMIVFAMVCVKQDERLADMNRFFFFLWFSVISKIQG